MHFMLEGEIRQKLQETPKAEAVSPVSAWEQAVKTTTTGRHWDQISSVRFKAFPAAVDALNQ